jgi:hypothetical protein
MQNGQHQQCANEHHQTSGNDKQKKAIHRRQMAAVMSCSEDQRGARKPMG